MEDLLSSILKMFGMAAPIVIVVVIMAIFILPQAVLSGILRDVSESAG